jgi:hypothetical protein
MFLPYKGLPINKTAVDTSLLAYPFYKLRTVSYQPYNDRKKIGVTERFYFFYIECSGAHPASYPKGNRGSFLGGKAAGVWS